MTEADWQSCCDPEEMLEFLADQISPRKTRLFACGCCRRVIRHLRAKESRRAVEVAEAFADGLTSPEALEEVYLEAWDTWENWPRMDSLTVKAVAAAAAAARPAFDVDEAFIVLQCSLAAEGTMSPADALLDRCELVREVFDNPFRPIALDPFWLTHAGGNVLAVARAIYDERRFEDFPILADALEDAGCNLPDVLTHCRAAGEHVRGCWVLDLLLNRS